MPTLPILTTVLKEESAALVRFHFSGLQDGRPFALTLARPLQIQATWSLDTPNDWEVLVKDGPDMIGPGDMYGFTVDASSPGGRELLTTLGYRF